MGRRPEKRIQLIISDLYLQIKTCAQALVWRRFFLLRIQRFASNL